ncbi:lysophospholipid acyltransferase LPCAT4 isoform X2 [Prionailurus viverrinus]|uniref:lysophospholipid acyltransferase LPCAT4 isoform X2 n=1 Tax=Prionailurus viverrinus TaxID=61388 RepID=UPI001FF3B624|nr:lysophospholipid acyltransferase LPCAT4 isoform X2 [Prionailurus viverrinus]
MSQGSPGDWAPLDPTPGPPTPPNPFVHELHLSRLQRVKFCLLGALLAPIRVLLAFIVLFLLWPFAWLQVAGLTEEQLQEPITGWRKTVCHNGVLGLSRLLFFLLGFLRIRVRGQRASRLQAPVLVAAPHSTFFDPIVLLPCDLPKVVSRAENLSVPVIGALLRFNQAILVSRHDPASRRRVVEEVRRRATSGGKWPQVLFFPEGTCSNKKALLKFKPGVPVQPVLIRYPNSLDTTSWAWRGPGVLKVLWLTASQPCSIVDVEFLPVYHPSPEESRNPTLYANNVQRVMAQALGIPATECEFVGSLPVIVVGRLKVALEPQLWELGKVLRKAGLSPGHVDAGAEPGRSRMISQEEFARQLQLSDPQTVAGAFSYFQQDAKGLVDFRDVALALAALDGGRSLEELTRLAFELFAEEQVEAPDRLLYKDGFSTILHLLLGSPRPAAATLHAELCQGGPHQGLSLCESLPPLPGRLGPSSAQAGRGCWGSSYKRSVPGLLPPRSAPREALQHLSAPLPETTCLIPRHPHCSGQRDCASSQAEGRLSASTSPACLRPTLCLKPICSCLIFLLLLFFFNLIFIFFVCLGFFFL